MFRVARYFALSSASWPVVRLLPKEVANIRVLMCGSRGWKDPGPINAVIAGLDVLAEGRRQRLTIIHGNAKSGADKLVDRIARDWGAEVIPVDADWTRYKNGAGPIRNQQMLDQYHPEETWAFRASGKSNGTDDMINRSRSGGVRTYVVTQLSEEDNQ